MTNLIKENLHSSIAQSIYREIVSRNSKYFYYLGGTTLEDVDAINSSLASERSLRDKIVLLKGVNPTDTCLVVPRYDWISGHVYDQYDDAVSDSILGINIIDSGYEYSSVPTISISGNGSGALAHAVLDSNGAIKEVIMDSSGKGYTTATVTVTGSLNNGGHNAILKAVINKTVENKLRIEEAKFYVMTDDHRVYKCIDNNGKSPSTVKPISTGPDIFTTADGYSWKFLYRIPPNMINKFVTSDYIPVINSLSDNFFDVGSISRLNIDNAGSGYQSADTHIMVTGDGYIASNPLLIKGISVSSGGSLYASSSTVEVDPPVSGSYKTWTNDPVMVVQRGDVIKYNSLFYKVVNGGTLSNVAPSVTIPNQEFLNGTAFLELIGESAVCNLTVTSGQISAAHLLGRIYDVDVIYGGSGYNVGQLSVTFKKADNTIVCSGIASCYDGMVQEIIVTSNTQTLVSASDISHYEIGSKFIPDFIYPANVHVTNGDYLYLTTEETQASTLSHTSGTVDSFMYVGKAAKLQPVFQYGYGYSLKPEYVISGGAGTGAILSIQTEKSEARIVPVIDSGSIVDYIIKDGGVGYTSARIDVISSSGVNASISASVFVGSIDTLESNNHLSNVVGGIHNIQMISNGYGYDANNKPAVVIVGDGTGAKAHIQDIYIDNDSDGSGSIGASEVATGRILKIIIDDPGKNYTYAKISINSELGVGASARAIISPFGGHGRDNIKELFASKVLVYAKLQNEKFSGFNIENDYRIFGLIKNPKNYTDSSYVSSSLASACHIAYCLFDATKFTPDSIISVVGNTGKKFKIIDIAEGAMIIQDLNNYKLKEDDMFEIIVAGVKYTTQVLSFIEPTFGKYTGEILNINYRNAGFTSSSSQSVIIRSVLGLSA